MTGESIFINCYRCSECSKEWVDVWSCACNDRCPGCNAEIEPYQSYEPYELLATLGMSIAKEKLPREQPANEGVL